MNSLYTISGCNGSGKTTASHSVFSEQFNCDIFINADEIAKEIEPLNPEKYAIKAGKIMLNKIYKLIEKEQDFAFETTLASKSLSNLIIKAKEKHYQIILIYFWLNSVELAISRVAERVSKGGHNVDENVIKRRYYSGIKNLFNIYINIVDSVYVFDNSTINSELVLESKSNEIKIKNEIILKKMKEVLKNGVS